YELTVTGTNGCTSVAQAEVGTNYTEPGAQATGGTLTCTVLSVQLTGNGNGDFAWTGPNGFTSGDQNPTVSVAGTYELTVTGTNGCTSVAQAEVGTNYTEPGAQATGGTLTCTVLSVQLTGSGNGDFAWTGPNGFTSGDQNPTVSVAGTYELTVTGANGCTSQAEAEVELDQNAPVISADGGLLDCETGTLQLNATAPTATGFLWSGPNGFASTEEDPIVAEVGTYAVTVTGENGCTASVEVLVEQDCDKKCPPLLVDCPADITLTCAEDLSPGTTGEPFFRKDKDCPAIVDLGWHDEWLSSCPYVIQRTFFATDAEGNTETCSHLITVIDEVAPVFVNVPEDLQVACDKLDDNMGLPDVWAYDECTKQYFPVQHQVEMIAGECAGHYYYVHTWSATDWCDNTGIATWTIEVYDNEPPVIDCTVKDMKVGCKNIPEALKCSATDNCDPDVEVVVIEEISKGDCKSGYTITRTYTATDDCGNSTVISHVIYVGGCGTGKSLDVAVIPNPFRDECAIRFIALETGKAVVEVSDMQGRRVAELFNGYVSEGQPMNLAFKPVENGGGTFIYRIILNGNEARGRVLYQP
ncbi:MAG: hypothetical protein ABI432_05000, partial [Flavobacteriales bacterium]